MKIEKQKILIVDDDEFSLENLQISLGEKYELHSAVSYNSAISMIENEKDFDLAIVDLYLPNHNGLEIFKYLRKNKFNFPLILITGYSDEESIIESISLGVSYVLKKPYDEEQLHKIIEDIFRKSELEKQKQNLTEKLHLENQKLRKQVNYNFEKGFEIIGQSEIIKSLLDKTKRIASSRMNVLINGETGTGKELLARFIHKNSLKSDKPFIAINASELSPSLFEAELFGYKKGSFTNAYESRAGLLEAAEGGFLFLDEITEIPLELQAKLLRVLEEKKVRRLGESLWRKIDITFISSTNRNINEIINQKIIREDLFHRLAQINLYLPPLRERTDDIQFLVNHFIKKYEVNNEISVPRISEKYCKMLKMFNWPGNIRQLLNFVNNWCLFGNDATEEEILSWLNNGYKGSQFNKNYTFENLTMNEIEQAKEWMIFKVLKMYKGNKSQTANHLGISYQGLLKMMKRFEEQKEVYN